LFTNGMGGIMPRILRSCGGGKAGSGEKIFAMRVAR